MLSCSVAYRRINALDGVESRGKLDGEITEELFEEEKQRKKRQMKHRDAAAAKILQLESSQRHRCVPCSIISVRRVSHCNSANEISALENC